MSKIHFTPEEVCIQYIDESTLTARQVADSVSNTQQALQVYRGSRATGISHPNDHLVPDGQMVAIRETGKSYFLDGLVNSVLIFPEKINHLLVRNCESVIVHLLGGTISGIHVLYGVNITISTSKHNWTSVEYVGGSQLSGELDADSQVHVDGSMDVSMNGEILPVNPFISASFTISGITEGLRFHPPNLTTLNS